MSTHDVDVMASLAAWDEWLVSAPVKFDTHTAVLKRRLGIA